MENSSGEFIDQPLYGNVAVKDIIREIHEDYKDKNSMIGGLIVQLSGMMDDISSATQMLPQIKNMLDADSRNTQSILTALTILQKAQEKKTGPVGKEAKETAGDFSPDEVASVLAKLKSHTDTPRAIA